MINPRRLAVYSLALLLAAALSLRADDPPKPKADPLSEAALIKLAKAGIEDDVIAALIKKRGVTFKADDATIRRLKMGGVSESVLATIRPATGDPDPAKTDGFVLGTAKHPLGVIVEVLGVKVDDTQNKLKVVWRYRNPTKKAVRIVEPTGPFRVPNPPYKVYWNAVNLTAGKFDSNPDETKSYRHSVLRTDAGDFDATDIRRLGIVVGPEATYEVFAKFDKPSAKVQKIHLYLPDLPLFENLPIEQSKQGK